MEPLPSNRFSGSVTVFHDRHLPEGATPVGYAALIEAFSLAVPLPRQLSAVSSKHRVYQTAEWRIFSPRYAPEASVKGHLVFALKHEGLELAVLKRLFLAVGPGVIAAIVREQPTGSYARRIWFLYEWLLGERLNVDDVDRGNYVPAVDPKLQWDVPGTKSARHRVTNNLPGTPAFCSLVYRTRALEDFTALDLSARAAEVIAKSSRDVAGRAAAFLLLRDSRSSYAIEGESVPDHRLQRWGRAMAEAGQHPLDLDELLRLQKMVMGTVSRDARFVRLGLRHAGGFVGEHDHDTGMPVPEHVSARASDLPSLVEGLIAFAHGPAQQLDPVIAAAVLAFGFVYIHPFADGNGRIHRYLMHHVLAGRGFSPPGVVFPVSAVMLQRIELYRRLLEDYSRRLLAVIEWQPTTDGNIEVLNDTADFYRFFDATPHAEFLFSCIRQTIEHDFPNEADFLRRYDAFSRRLDAIVAMPAHSVDLLFRFLQQQGGRLSGRARAKEFASLAADEIARIEESYAALFSRATCSRDGPA